MIERLSPDTTSDGLTSPPPATVVRFTHCAMTCSMSRVAMPESRITPTTVTILRLVFREELVTPRLSVHVRQIVNTSRPNLSQIKFSDSRSRAVHALACGDAWTGDGGDSDRLFGKARGYGARARWPCARPAWSRRSARRDAGDLPVRIVGDGARPGVGHRRLPDRRRDRPGDPRRARPAGWPTASSSPCSAAAAR